MRRILIPHNYQRLITSRILSDERQAIFAGLGMGKTVSTMSALELEFATGLESRPALVLAPKRVAVSTWPDEVNKWEHLHHIEVQPIIGTEAERLKALKNKNASIFTINYENITWLVETLNGRWPFGHIVADESTRLKSFRVSQGGKRASALASVAFRPKSRMTLLTGTPTPNGLQDLWGQMYFIDKGQRLGRSFSAFENRWFGRGFDGFSLKPHSFAQAQIQDAIRDVCLSIRSEDYFELKKSIVVNKFFDLPPKIRKQYSAMEKEMFTQLAQVVNGKENKHDIEAVNPAVRTNKCLQISNGAVYVEPDVLSDDNPKAKKWVEIHDIKLQILEEIKNETSGAPLLVAYHFKSDLARLKKAFPKGRELDSNPQTLRDWNAGKIEMLFAHPASAGHGLNLQDGGHILVFFSVYWNLEEHEQIIERIGPMRQLQSGYNRNVWIYRILARDTMDEEVLQRLDGKKTVQEILKEALSKKGYI